MTNDFHEKETVKLFATVVQSRNGLHAFLKKRGFSSEDDFYFLPRCGRTEDWQSDSVVTVNVAFEGHAIYETEEDLKELDGSWDELVVEYPIATLPATFIPEFVRECAAIMTQFQLKMKIDSEELNASQLQTKLESIADDLREQWDEPGSETLRVLIEQSYS